MAFCCINFSTMEYVELLLTGLKITYIVAPTVKIGDTKSSYVTIVCGMPQESTLGPSYFYFILLTCQTALRNCHFEFLQMAQICFTQVISYNIHNILKQSLN